MESPKDIRKRVASIRALAPVDVADVEAVSDKKVAKRIFGDFGCVRNESDGYEVRFSKEAVGKILRHRGFDQSAIIAVLDKVFAKSLWAWDDPVRFEAGKKRHRNFARYRNYVGKVASGGQTLFVRFTVTETFGAGSLVHSTFVSDVRLYEDKSAGGLSVPDNNRAKVASALLTDDRLANWFASVNGGADNRRPVSILSAEIVLWFLAVFVMLLCAGWIGRGPFDQGRILLVVYIVWRFFLPVLVHYGFRLIATFGLMIELGWWPGFGHYGIPWDGWLALCGTHLLPLVLLWLPMSNRWIRGRK